jgi:phosphohistidine phosphatase
MPRMLLLMRHGKSSWEEEGLADRDRPLTKRGKRDALAQGERLAVLGVVPQVILSSSAKRAHDTAKRVAGASGFGGEVGLDDRLYFQGLGPYYEALAALSAEVTAAMIVGHNPPLEQMAAHLCGQVVAMTTAVVVAIELPVDTWAALGENTRGVLRFTLVPGTPKADAAGPVVH